MRRKQEKLDWLLVVTLVFYLLVSDKFDVLVIEKAISRLLPLFKTYIL